MAQSSAFLFSSKPDQVESSAQFFRARCRTFELPPIRDAVVVGRQAPVALDSLEQTLRLTGRDDLVSWAIQDDIVGAIIARRSLLQKITQPVFTQFVLHRVKPIMVSREVLRVDFDVEVIVEGTI